jgi:hypothetical protein
MNPSQEIYMTTTSNFFTPTIAFILTLAFGFWLSRKGKPYNGILFNIHKLIALGTVILLSIKMYGTFRNLEFERPHMILLILAGLCVLALFASGAFLSTGNMNYRVVKTIHNVAPVLLVIVVVLISCLVRLW